MNLPIDDVDFAGAFIITTDKVGRQAGTDMIRGFNVVDRPCDDDPCKNNGTCRPTPGSPPFFCDCVGEWGGKHCEIPIPKPKQPKYGKNVKLVSSGQPEWIEELKRRKAKVATEVPKPIKTAKDMVNGRKVAPKMVNDEPMESSGDSYFEVGDSGAITSSSENGTEALDIGNAMKAGQTGGELGADGKPLESGATATSIVASLLLFIFAKIISA
uniref:EGF-like domain-containing protein n=1 Tax=Panagrellus redivivus TaxID=6233 RepID=A0A7E4V6F6_PANRE